MNSAVSCPLQLVVAVLKSIAQGDATEGVEDGQVELTLHIHRLAGQRSQMIQELAHLLLNHLLHTCTPYKKDKYRRRRQRSSLLSEGQNLLNSLPR